jgi:hypothetical protein
MNYFKAMTGPMVTYQYTTDCPNELALIATACEVAGVAYDVIKNDKTVTVQYTVKAGVQSLIDEIMPKYRHNLEESRKLL